MSNDITKFIERIHKDVCEGCRNKCALCEHGVCEDVVIEVGLFFLHVAEKEQEEE